MNTNRLLSVIILICLPSLVAIADVWQDPETKVNYVYYPNEERPAMVVNSEEASGDIVILSNILGHPVKSIGERAFADCHGRIKSVAIQPGITYIGWGAFSGLENLRSVSLPEDLIEIGDLAFNGCNSLSRISFPESLKAIGYQAFNWCSSLDSVVIPGNVSHLGDEAFRCCIGMKELTISKGVTSIGNNTFETCDKLTSIVIPSSVKNIGDNAFWNCYALENVELQNGLESIGNGAFAVCYSMKNLHIPESVTSIGRSAFAGCWNLSSINIPQNIKIINEWTFSDCSKLTDIVIPDSVTTIGVGAFEKCRGLTRITIPASVTAIVNSAFYGCTGLTSVISLIEEPFEIEEIAFMDGWGNFSTATLYVPKGTKEKYEAMPVWNKFPQIVELDENPNVDDDPDSMNGKMGDVNNDGTVDVTDAVLIIDEILMKSPANFDASLADVNHDTHIDVTDVVLVIDKILGKIELSRGATQAEKDLTVYTAFQMDLTIPAGYVLEGVELTEMAKKSHSLAYNKLADGRCRMVVFSMDNEALPGAWDEVIRLNLRGQGDATVNVDRAMFVTVGGERHELLLNGTTSIAQFSIVRSASPLGSSKNSQLSILYDLTGRKVAKTAKGVYVIDGKKVVR